MYWRAFSVIAYGILIIIGGYMGYTQANSTASLIMGTFCGTLALVSGRGLMKNTDGGRALALVLAGFLLIFFGSRYYRSGQFMPAGLMSLLSIYIIAVVSTGYKDPAHRKV